MDARGLVVGNDARGGVMSDHLVEFLDDFAIRQV